MRKYGKGKVREECFLQSVDIAGLSFGRGLPKICVPLTGGSMPALLSEAQTVRDLPADLYEWRMDSYFGSYSEALDMLEQELGGKPLLCTLRTKGEGGASGLAAKPYESFLSCLLDRGGFQLLDIELSCGEDRVRSLTAKAKGLGIGAVVSCHDFEKTPPEEEMVRTLVRMKELGADLPKLAVMPQSPRDVLSLLSASLRAAEQAGPVIAMAMGDLGKISRVSGAVFGSCLTFGAGQNASAPGQMDTEDLRAVLEDLDPRLSGEQKGFDI